MESQTRRRSSARLLAPAALVAFGVALLLMIAGSGGGGTGGSNQNAAAERRDLGTPTGTPKRQTKQAPAPKATASVYVVKQGDTLAGIAEKTGVSVVRLQDLNQGLDQFQLTAGQRIKLR